MLSLRSLSSWLFPIKYPKFKNVRYVVIVACWFALVNLNMQRILPSISTIRTSDKDQNVYTSKEQDYLLMTYTIGYFLGHIPGAILANLFQCRRVTMLSLCVSFILIYISIFVWDKFIPTFIIRCIISFFHGPVFSTVMQASSASTPQKQRTLAVLFLQTSNIFAALIVFPFGAYLRITFKSYGTEYIHILVGTLGLLSTLLWILFVYDTPESNPWMIEDEKKLIVDSIYPNGRPPPVKLSEVPFKSMILSFSSIAAYCAHFGKLWILYFYQIGLIKYFIDRYGVNLMSASLYAICPFISGFFFQIMYSRIVEIYKRKGMSNTNIRKLNNTMGALFSAIFLFPVAFLPNELLPLSIVLICLSQCCIAGLNSGYSVALIDMAPRYSLFSFTLANMLGTNAGTLVRVISANLDDKNKYQILNSILASSTIIFNIPFLIWGSAELQPWANKNKKLESKSTIEAISISIQSDDTIRMNELDCMIQTNESDDIIRTNEFDDTIQTNELDK